MTGVDLTISKHGKPFHTMYSRATESILDVAGGKLDTIYMIGDNPLSDIAGANAAALSIHDGWESVSVYELKCNTFLYFFCVNKYIYI